MKKVILSILVFASLNSVFAEKVPKQITVEVCGGKISENTQTNGELGTKTVIVCGQDQAAVCFTYTLTVMVEKGITPHTPSPFDPIEVGTYTEIFDLGNLIANGYVVSSVVNIYYPNPGQVSHEIVLKP